MLLPYGEISDTIEGNKIIFNWKGIGKGQNFPCFFGFWGAVCWCFRCGHDLSERFHLAPIGRRGSSPRRMADSRTVSSADECAVLHTVEFHLYILQRQYTWSVFPCRNRSLCGRQGDMRWLAYALLQRSVGTVYADVFHRRRDERLYVFYDPSNHGLQRYRAFADS